MSVLPKHSSTPTRISSSPTKVLGVDFGERRIGLAVSEDGKTALPLTTIERRSDRQAVDAIRSLAAERRIESLVVGEPLTLEGERGSAAARARRFGSRLATATGLRVCYVDEALTSYEASRRAPRTASGKRKAQLDALAAQLLLQDALDRWQEGAYDGEPK